MEADGTARGSMEVKGVESDARGWEANTEATQSSESEGGRCASVDKQDRLVVDCVGMETMSTEEKQGVWDGCSRR